MSITPIELDVQISLSRTQSLTPTDMTLQCFNTPNVDFCTGSASGFSATAIPLIKLQQAAALYTGRAMPFSA